ncbi:MAG: 3'-5' exonuclease [Candidatus Peregrinibacteria bacterium]
MQLIPFPDLIRRYFSGEGFVIFDTETTGLNTFHDDIVEVAGSVWQRGEEPRFFEELIRVSPHRMTPGAWQIHQIPMEALERARPATEVLRDFVEFCGGRSLIAHNIRFDFDMLNYNLIRNNLKPYPASQVFCSLQHAQRQSLPGKLSALASHYQISVSTDALHRARYDVELLTGIMNRLMKDHEPNEMQYSLVL